MDKTAKKTVKANEEEETQWHNLNFVKDGKFYIYGDIDDTIPSAITAPLIKEIEQRSKKKDPKPIEVYISSAGGYLCYGFDIITQFELAKKLGVPIHTYVTSYACSCGSLIACAGEKRFASRRAYHLLHFARGWEYSHNPVMAERNLENWKFVQSELAYIYKKYTKIKDVEGKMIADNYMINGGEALLKAGLIDEII